MNMKKKILIIGVNSFSGASFARYVIEKDWDVIGLSRSEEPHSVFLPFKWSAQWQKRYQFLQADLNTDLERILAVIERERPAYIVNYAALGMVAQSWEKPEDWYQTNVVAQVKFHDELRIFQFIEKYIHVTTPEVYGNTTGWIKENNNFFPSTPYAVSRAACDMHLLSFFQAYNFPVIFTRTANVYGPGQQLYRIIPRSILYVLIGKKLSLHGGGTSKRSFIHIDDASDATLRILLNGDIGNTYHISTESLISIRDLVIKTAQQLECDLSQLIEDSEDRLGKDQSYMLDSTKLRQELNWSDKISLDTGIADTISWVKGNLDILKLQPHKYIHKF